MKSPTLRYDADAQALYIRFSSREIEETIELSDAVYVDVDAEGNPVGFEVLGADSPLLTDLPDFPNDTELRKILKARAA